MTVTNRNIRLLLVDDEEDFRRATRSALERRGFVVREAASGERALESLQDERPDVVLLDLKMPGLSGIETLRRIRIKDETLPVVILTGHGNFQDALAGIRLDIVDFIPKPVDMDELAAKLRRMVNHEGGGQPLREKSIRELMVPPGDYPILYVDQPVAEAVAVLHQGFFGEADSAPQQCLRSALVYNHTGDFVGILRFSDLVRLVLPAYLGDSPYTSYFTGMFLAQCKVLKERSIEEILEERISIHPSAPIMEAISLMVDHQLINLPVMEAGRLLGILREKDIIREIARHMGVEE